ncbi:MAG TPA: hypothetical protein VKT18_04900 [Acidimicrobiales bacterium]|nr:hypothetical protein [Acidimicrobiales bacterium]
MAASFTPRPFHVADRERSLPQRLGPLVLFAVAPIVAFALLVRLGPVALVSLFGFAAVAWALGLPLAVARARETPDHLVHAASHGVLLVGPMTVYAERGPIEAVLRVDREGATWVGTASATSRAWERIGKVELEPDLDAGGGVLTLSTRASGATFIVPLRGAEFDRVAARVTGATTPARVPAGVPA